MSTASTKTATTVEQQIALLRSRQVIVSDEKKAKEYLLDIGYYRLGFYLFPFEQTYPELLSRRRHDAWAGTRIEDAVALYYFDFDLRNILNRYLSRIEVAIRTTIIYYLSNKYKSNPTWFVDSSVVNNGFISSFNREVYLRIRAKSVIKRHHQRYPDDVYAPAWKTMEFMTMGNLNSLYSNLLCLDDRLLICRHFGVRNPNVFFDYLEAIRLVRNAVAHGNVVYDLNLYTPVSNGPAGRFTGPDRHNLSTALQVVRYLLGIVSVNRVNDMDEEMQKAARRLFNKCPALEPMIIQKTGIDATVLPEKYGCFRSFFTIICQMLTKSAK